MLAYLSSDIICFSKLTVFLELHAQKTVYFSEHTMSVVKYLQILASMETIVYLHHALQIWQAYAQFYGLFLILFEFLYLIIIMIFIFLFVVWGEGSVFKKK